MLYVRFPLKLRKVEDLLLERGIDMSHETARYLWHPFRPIVAAELRRCLNEEMRSSFCLRHLNEMFVKKNGERHYL